MGTKEKSLRAAIVAECRAMAAAGLSDGTSGNISARLDDSFLITPSAIPYEALKPELLATMPVHGEYGAWAGRLKPSSEWRFHLDIMRARPDVGAIVHSHPPYGTALAALHRPILACHYMIAAFGGSVVECTRYAPYGTKELSDLALAGLGARHAVLLGNHGAIVVGPDLETAMARALQLEQLAQIYYLAICAGRPIILSDEEIARIVERFKTYGGGAEAQMAQKASRPAEETRARQDQGGGDHARR